MRTIFTTEENERLFRLAAEHGIEPALFVSLADCMRTIYAFDNARKQAFIQGFVAGVIHAGVNPPDDIHEIAAKEWELSA